MTVSVGGRCRTVVWLVLVILFGGYFAFAETDKVIVKTSRRNNEAITVDIGPAVPQSDGYGGTYEVAGMHGWVVSCNNDQPSCHMPHTGDSGYLAELDKKEEIYSGENLKIHWANGTVGIYALKETY